MASLRWQAAHDALRQLWDGIDIAVELDQIYTVEPALVHSILPQLINYLLGAASTRAGSSAGAALERQLLRTCAGSLSFALEMCWLLRAQPLPPSEEPPADDGNCLETASASTPQQQQSHSKAVYVTALLARVREAVRHADAQQGRREPASGEHEGRQALLLPAGCEESMEAQMLASLRFVDALTTVSDQLRKIERPLRSGALRSQLLALNCFLPPLEAPGWRPSLPTTAPETPPRRLMRLLEAEAFPLSTKERCPYLVFCEVAEDACADNAMARLLRCAPACWAGTWSGTISSSS